MGCQTQAELADAREIISVFREDNVRLTHELEEIEEKMSDVADLCDVLLLIEDSRVKILAGIMKQRILSKRNVPVGRAEQGTNQMT